MPIVSLRENWHEMSTPNFWEKYHEFVICRTCMLRVNSSTIYKGCIFETADSCVTAGWFEFNDPVNRIKVMLSWSVSLANHNFPGQLS